MRVIREIEVGGQKVQVKELTMGEIRAMVRAAEAAPASQMRPDDVLDAMLFEECALPELYAMTDLTAEAAATLAPSQLAQVIAAAKELNAAFFGMRGRLQRTLDRFAASLARKP